MVGLTTAGTSSYRYLFLTVAFIQMLKAFSPAYMVPLL
jgi:hypothetical protein